MSRDIDSNPGISVNLSSDWTSLGWQAKYAVYVQHLQICFESGGTYSRDLEKAGFSLPYKVYGAESAFLILISDLYDPVGPPLVSRSKGWAKLTPIQSLLTLVLATPLGTPARMFHLDV